MSVITHLTPTLPWAEAYQAFLAAYGAEKLHDRTVYMPAYHAAGEGDARVPLSAAIEAEADRLMALRDHAEEVMIAAPAPDMAAVLAKIAYARKRWEDCDDWPEAWWNAVLADMNRFSRLVDEHMGWLERWSQLCGSYLASLDKADDGDSSISDEIGRLEAKILDTPASSRDGLLAKALLCAAMNISTSDENPANKTLAQARAMGLMPTGAA